MSLTLPDGLTPGPLRRRFLRALAGLLLVATACDTAARVREPARDSIRVTDVTGHVVQLAAPAQRVISLVPSITEMIVALEASNRLVARTQFDTDPQLAALPSTANALHPSPEWVIAQQPDLVVVWQDQSARTVVDQLAATGVAVYGARTESLADVRRSLYDLGALLGLQARADSAVTRFNAALDSVQISVQNAPRKSVLYLISIEPPMAAGPGTYIDELIRIAGGSNLFPDSRSVWPQVSLEEILRRRPAIIVLAQENPTDVTTRLRARPGWRELNAVQNGQVFVVDADLFNRPGPRLPQAAAQLARIVHPGVAR